LFLLLFIVRILSNQIERDAERTARTAAVITAQLLSDRLNFGAKLKGDRAIASAGF
jgi:hypothetical protein